MALKTEIKYFEANQDFLKQKYSNKWLVVKSKKVVGAFTTLGKAFKKATSLKIKDYLIRHVDHTITHEFIHVSYGIL